MKAQNISGDFTELAQQKTELQSSKDSILKANLKIKKLEESIKTMRYQFMKELQNYKNQLFRAQKYPDNFEPIKVNYFSGLDNIDEQTTELLNKKIEQVGDDYNFKILRMQKHACSLEDKIMKFEKICREQNVGIKIDEMNADDIIYKLSIVENQSQPIWEAVTKHYGSGFFNKMIEKEFGINPDSHEEIGNRFGQEVSSIRIKANDSFNQLSSEMKVHIEGLKTRLRQKHTEWLSLKEEVEEEVKKISEDIQEKWDQKMIELRAIDFKKYDEEKWDLFKVIRNLEANIAKLKGSDKSQNFNKQSEKLKSFTNQSQNGNFDEKSKLLKSEDESAGEDDGENEGEGEKEIKPVDWPILSQHIIDELREQKTKAEIEANNYKYLHTVSEQNYKRVNNKYTVLANDASSFKESNPSSYI